MRQRVDSVWMTTIYSIGEDWLSAGDLGFAFRSLVEVLLLGVLPLGGSEEVLVVRGLHMVKHLFFSFLLLINLNTIHTLL